ncbi:SARP family transcriptional regulator [Lentzea sp. NBRC 105346]|uniref:AfsR/SARP family transcriptional regulator n=1 Tax=Lentzea sp. NBRC 105346 TaxID=3032205 RepID=UPI0024A385D1|nr:BTAD domain-containing putative transcriptional regulator [Lentzea sp. NBRC 105346]GLZ31940.1 SARP family transcriptional regulator [Lentzea sp. NBRC 105346]
MTLVVEFKILGRTRLLIDGADIHLGTAKQRGVLTLLLHDVGRPVSIELIVSELWRGETFNTVRGRLQPIISKIRKALTDAGTEADLVKEGGSYRLQLDPMLVDLHRFRHLVTTARHASQADDYFLAKTLLQEALALWQGTPLDDVQGTWSDHCRAQMEQFDRLPAYYLLFDSQLQLGEYHEVMSAVGRLTEEHATEETFVRQYMESLDGVGKYPKALEVYEDFCALLDQELGAEPGPEMRTLYQAILRKQAGTGVVAKADFEPPELQQRDVHNFTGRKELLAQLDALLDTARGQVVLLHGMPGAGKTSLATRWAHFRKKRFPDGQLFLDLRGFGPEKPMAAEDAIAILLASLGVRLAAVPQPTIDEQRVRLHKLLRDKKILLILDNVRETAQVRPVLAATAGCCCLVTARSQLAGLTIREGVQTLRVDPMTAPESIALLQAELLGTGRNDEAGGLAALTRIAAGLPLGLKIIAQHVVERPYTPLTELAEEFRQRGLDALDAPHSDDEGATLSGVFSWSLQALPPATVRAFRLLGLHPGAEFDVIAACAALGEDYRGGADHLRVLAKANLVRQSSSSRYRLHDLLHDYAVDLAQRKENEHDRESALRRLLDWYLKSAANAAFRVTPDRTQVPALSGISSVHAREFATLEEALEWFELEQPNLAAAVSRAAENDFHDHAWRISANMHEAFDRLGYYPDLLSSHEIALRSARSLGDREAQCGTLNNIGVVQHWLGRFDDAEQSLRAGAALADEMGHLELSAVCRHNLASVHLRIGQARIAIEVYEQVLELLKRMNDRSIEAYTLDQIANAHHRLERDDIALQYHAQALEMRKQVGDHRGQGNTLTELARINHEHGQSAKALECARNALEAHSHSGDKAGMGDALLIMAETLFDLGSFTEAAEAAEKSARLCRDPHKRSRGLHVLGHTFAVQNDPAAADRCWQQAVAELRASGAHENDVLLIHLHDHGASHQEIPGPRTDGTIARSAPDLPVRDQT